MSLMMSEKTWRCLGELAFVACVSVIVLSLLAAETARGSAGVHRIVVYAFAAGFGLEFVSATWRGLWGPPRATRSLPR